MEPAKEPASNSSANHTSDHLSSSNNKHVSSCGFNCGLLWLPILAPLLCRRCQVHNSAVLNLDVLIFFFFAGMWLIIGRHRYYFSSSGHSGNFEFSGLAYHGGILTGTTSLHLQWIFCSAVCCNFHSSYVRLK